VVHHTGKNKPGVITMMKSGAALSRVGKR